MEQNISNNIDTGIKNLCDAVGKKYSVNKDNLYALHKIGSGFKDDIRTENGKKIIYSSTTNKPIAELDSKWNVNPLKKK